MSDWIWGAIILGIEIPIVFKVLSYFEPQIIAALERWNKRIEAENNLWRKTHD